MSLALFHAEFWKGVHVTPAGPALQSADRPARKRQLITGRIDGTLAALAGSGRGEVIQPLAGAVATTLGSLDGSASGELAMEGRGDLVLSALEGTGTADVDNEWPDRRRRYEEELLTILGAALL